jgi:spermidine/putrescine transport system permease protein
MLGSGGRLVSNLIQAQFLQLNNWPLGAALSIVTMLAVAIVSFVFILLNRRWLRGRA